MLPKIINLINIDIAINIKLKIKRLKKIIFYIIINKKIGIIKYNFFILNHNFEKKVFNIINIKLNLIGAIIKKKF